MEEIKIVYKRTSAWWTAFCYLAGTFFLLLFMLAYLAYEVLDFGMWGIEEMTQSSKSQSMERLLASEVHEQVRIVNFQSTLTNDAHQLAITILNESRFGIESLKLNVAYLDTDGVPLAIRDEALDLDVIYPGDQYYTKLELPLVQGTDHANIALRVSRIGLVGEGQTVQQACRAYLAEQ